MQYLRSFFKNSVATSQQFNRAIVSARPLAQSFARSFADSAEGNGKQLFVANIPWDATEQDLQNLFQKYGNVVSVKVMKDLLTGRSRGFGFVTLEAADIDKVVAETSNTEFKGRQLKVDKATPRPPRAPREGGDRPMGDRPRPPMRNREPRDDRRRGGEDN